MACAAGDGEPDDDGRDGATAAGPPLLAVPHPTASSAVAHTAAASLLLLIMGLRLPVRQQVMLLATRQGR